MTSTPKRDHTATDEFPKDSTEASKTENEVRLVKKPKYDENQAS